MASIEKLDVTVNAVDQYIHETQKKCANGKKVLNLHLGVGPNKIYLLETCGYNNKDFRIPDNEGNVCKN